MARTQLKRTKLDLDQQKSVLQDPNSLLAVYLITGHAHLAGDSGMGASLAY
jgi:hypothetical protein